MKWRFICAVALLSVALTQIEGNPNSAPFIYFGGEFTSNPTSSGQLGGAAIWNYVNNTWQEGGAANPVKVFTSKLHDTRLYMAGNFATIGNIASTGQSPIAAAVAYLDTTTQVWHSMATNANGPVYAVAVNPDTGRLWAVGGMTLLAPTLTGTGGVGEYIEDIGSWVFAGNSPTEFILASDTAPVRAIAFDASGHAIIGGNVGFSAGIRVLKGLARMDSSGLWQVLGNGVCGGEVEKLVVWNNKLYVAGTFTKVNDVDSDCGASATDAPGFAIYDLGTNGWSTGGAMLSQGDSVHALELTDFQARNETSHLADFLLVGGQFNSLAGNTALAGLAKYDGSTWSAAAPVVAPIGGEGKILAVSTDGFNLYIGGNFSTSNTTQVAQWDGSQWNSLAGGLICISPTCEDAIVHTITPFYSLTAEVVTPLQWGGFDLSKYINWKYWLACLCAVLVFAMVLSLLTNCCWKTIACCKSCCYHNKPREKEPGL